MKKIRRGVNSNNIEVVVEEIKNNLYSKKKAYKQDDVFYFGKPLIGNGSNEDHCHIMITSLSLMNNCSKKGVFHVDGTYKIFKAGFPLVVYGVTDLCGQFHPIAFFITSHETEDDFFIFYSELLALTNSLKIHFDPKFIMQDALPASYNAATRLFPNATILMCYFHVKKNIKENKEECDDSVFETMMKDIEYMHLATSELVFNKLLDKFSKYKINNSVMYNYIYKQWLTSRYNKWQIFRTPPGYAAKNSNIESFNAVIKRSYTKRESVKGGLETIGLIITDYSNTINTFEVLGRYTEKVHEKAKLLKADNYKKYKSSQITVKGENGDYLINFKSTDCPNGCSCSCPMFLKYCVCKHLVGYCILNNLNNIVDQRYLKKKTCFVMKMKRGAPKKNGKALSRE